MRLALCRPDRVGDVILATACLEPIRRQFPDARLLFLAREAMRPLLEGHPSLVGNGFIALPPSHGWRDHRALAERLRGEWIDALVHLHPDGMTAISGRLAGVPRQIGYRTAGVRDFFTLSDPLTDRRAGGRQHEALANFDLLAPLGVRPPATAEDLRPRVVLAERWRESWRVKSPASPYLVLNPTAHALDLRWPAEHFLQLAREVAAARPDLAVVLVAERADDPSVTFIRAGLGAVPWLVDLAGQTNLGELAWLLREARALVSRNTGTTHLAAAVGCPLVEIFGRAEPAYGPGRWRALGEPARTRVVAARPSRRRLLEGRRAWWRRLHASVPVAEVRAALDEVLSAG